MRHIGDLLDLDKVRSELARHQIATQYGDLGGGDIRLVTLGADGATPVVHIGPGYVPEGPVAGANADRLAVIGDLVVAPDDDGNPDDEAIERATIDARGIGDRSEEAIACTAAMMHRALLTSQRTLHLTDGAYELMLALLEGVDGHEDDLIDGGVIDDPTPIAELRVAVTAAAG